MSPAELRAVMFVGRGDSGRLNFDGCNLSFVESRQAVVPRTRRGKENRGSVECGGRHRKYGEHRSRVGITDRRGGLEVTGSVKEGQ